MAFDVTLWGAVLAGLVSFLSPCVLPLVPPYLCYMAGVSLDQLTGQNNQTVAKRTVMISSAAFVLGFSTVFVALGATASALGSFVARYSWEMSIVGGIIIVIMGLHFLGVFRIGLLMRQARIDVRNQQAGPVGSYLVGLAFAVGWTPCIGPVLGTILLVAGAEQTVARGATLLLAYSLGLGVPFLIAGLFAGPFMRFMARFRGHMDKVEKTMGAALVVTGVLFMTGQITTFSFWLLSVFPSLATLG
ncbi:MAG: cytochrome c biogenesis CcdA family protein [Alphaproteobacteria bacterium]